MHQHAYPTFEDTVSTYLGILSHIIYQCRKDSSPQYGFAINFNLFFSINTSISNKSLKRLNVWTADKAITAACSASTFKRPIKTDQRWRN